MPRQASATAEGTARPDRATVVPIPTPFAERHRVIEMALRYATWAYTHGQHGRARWFLQQARRAREARHG